jgi:hypothetical protein
VIDPHRRIDQNHFLAIRRRRGALRLGSLPPKRASRRAASRSINALSASRISADFAFNPVYACALANSLSSSAMVVRIHIFSLINQINQIHHHLMTNSMPALLLPAPR